MKKRVATSKDIFVTQKPVSQMTIPATQSICQTVENSQMELFEETIVPTSDKGKETTTDIPIATLKGKQKKEKDIFITQLPVSQLSILPSQNEEDYELTNKPTVSIDLSLVDKTLSETSTNDSMRKDLSNDSSIVLCNVDKNDNNHLKPDKNKSELKNIKNKTRKRKKNQNLEKEEDKLIVYEEKNDKSVTAAKKDLENEVDTASQVIPFPNTKLGTLSMSAAKKSDSLKDKNQTSSKRRTSDRKKGGNEIEGKSNQPTKKVFT